MTAPTNISIHAPARGATTLLGEQTEYDMISIHAPARGATIEVQRDEVGIIDFNSRSREGSAASLSGIFLVFCKFQSALPRGERPLPGILQNLANNFNPRSREGSDLVHTLYVVPRWDFNPRSHKGSDNVISGLGISVELFQSALPRGERRSI